MKTNPSGYLLSSGNRIHIEQFFQPSPPLLLLPASLKPHKTFHFFEIDSIERDYVTLVILCLSYFT